MTPEEIERQRKELFARWLRAQKRMRDIIEMRTIQEDGSPADLEARLVEELASIERERLRLNELNGE